MARRKKSKTKRKAKKKTKAVSHRKTKRKVKRSVKRVPRRSAAEMSPRELWLSRRRRSAQRFGRIAREFGRTANMTPVSLSKWLQTRESRAANPNRGGAHWAGRRVVEIKRKRGDALSSTDYADMRKIVAFVKRRSARRPAGDVRNTPWRHSLMNWGHDPLK